MRSAIASIICAFLVLNADTSPVHEYFERPSVERANRSQTNSNQVHKNGGHWMGEARKLENKRFHVTSNDVIVEGNAIEDKGSEQDLEMLVQVSSVFCEVGKTSGWLQCTDPTGETDRSEAEKVCQAHGQTIWTYAPKSSYQSYGFWICAKSRSRATRKQA